MWKVFIVICALGNPCVIMEEDPIQHYTDYDKCMQVAEKKHDMIKASFSVYGFHVENTEFSCVKVDNLTNS